jgi:hypothetical protein
VVVFSCATTATTATAAKPRMERTEIIVRVVVE